MKLTKESVLGKTVTGVVAIATGMFMLGGVFVAPASAQTSAELQAQIESLLAQIAALQSQLSGGGSSPAGLYCDFTFTRDLAVGATGQDVMALQKFLNSVPGVQVAASGVGSAGMESSYFGTLTAQAVSAFQVKYSSEILAPLGLTSGTGYWGQSSRGKAVSLCAAAPSPTGEVCGDDVDNDGDGFVDEGCDGDDSDDDSLQGGEGSITDYEILSEYNDEDVMQGQTEKVFGFQFEADGSDISVRRVDILFEANDDNANATDDADAEPWDFIEEVTLYHGDEAVATMDADSSSDWSKVTTSDMDGESDDDTYRIRFSGLSEKVSEDATSQWSLEVTARGVLDSADIAQNFEIAVADDGIRAVDAAGINIYGGSDAAAYQTQMTFDDTTAGTLELSDSDDFDDDVVAKASATVDTDNIIAGMFQLEADEQDVTVEDLTANVVIVGSDVDTLVSSVGLYVGDTLIERKTVSSAASASTTVTFDDIDYVIEEDEKVTFTLKANVQELDGTTDQTEGIVFFTAVYGSGITAEDAEGDSVTVSENWNAGATGDYTVSLYTKLPALELVSATADKGSNADSSGVDEDATYTFTFKVQAIGGDIYVPDSALGTTTSGGAGTSDDALEVRIVGSGTASTSASSVSSVITSSDATDVGDTFKVPSGTTKTFTVTVNYDNENAGAQFVHAVAQAFNWGLADDSTAEYSFTAGFNGWETSPVHLDN